VWFIPSVFVAIVLFQATFAARDILRTWPGDVNEVQFVWQTALRDAAAYLDGEDAGAVAIGGWSPESVDVTTMALYLQREDLTLRHYHPLRALIIPAEVTRQQPARLIQPAILPLHPVLAGRLAAWGIELQAHGRFVEYQISRPPEPDPDFPASVRFGDELFFLGHSLDASCQPGSGQPCHAITYWRVLQPTAEPRRIFFHALDSQSQVVAAGDDLGAPSVHWQSGDLLVQRHELALGGDVIDVLQTGVYNPESGVRLLTPEGDDALRLAVGFPATRETP
jgi:hypothetical protein